MLLLVLKFAVECMFRNGEENWEELDMNGTYQLVCANDVICYARTNTLKNAKGTNVHVLSSSAGQNCNLKVANKFLKNWLFKYFE
jgi:hypothetical protein